MIERFFNESIAVKQNIMNDVELMGLIYQAAQACTDALRNGKKIIFAGNGGSFADAQHLAAELTGRFLLERPSLPAIVLGVNSSSMSAIGNDYGFEDVYARELSALGQEGDVFLAISTSGNSPNILSAVTVAIEKNVTVFGFTGYTGGKLATICPCIQVPSGSTPRIQESHILIGHAICGYIEDQLYRK
ncbi:SIS domain-containing protein [bacterium]|nr:SIS domain-containing protein [bacterium]